MKKGGFTGGDPNVRAALNGMEEDLDTLQKEVKRIDTEQRAARSPFRFIVVENGFPSAFIMNAQRVEAP